MKHRTELLLRSLAKDRKNRQRRLAVLTALAVLTGGSVYWELREIGTALTNEQLCGLEAHEHSADCYDENGELICGKEEHIHTSGCTDGEPAEAETPAVWEISLPAEEGLTRQEQAARIAESQLGYTESELNFVLDENGDRQGYTRYGAWYGNPYGDWNTMFAYFCMYYAGVTAEDVPSGGNARTWQLRLEETGLLHPPDTQPERGTIVFLDTDADGTADRTGIVTGAGEVLTVIEGDLESTVAAAYYPPDDTQILGYVALPEPDMPEAADTGTDDSNEPGIRYFSAESPSGIRVCASAPETAFPPDTVMQAADVPRESALQTAAEHLETDTLEAVAVDIGFYAADGTELEPDGYVEVQIALPEELTLPEGEYTLLHISDDGDVQRMEAVISGSGAEFTTVGFSIYVVTVNGTKTTDSVIMANGEKGNNSADNPYLLYIGEYLDISYEGAYLDSGCFTVFENGPDDNKILDRTLWDTVSGSQKKAQFRGNREGICQIGYKQYASQSVSNLDGSLWVQVIAPTAYMVMSDGSRMEIHRALEELNKALLSDPLVIYAVEGETFTLSVNGYRADLIAPNGSPDYYNHEEYAGEYDLSASLHRGKPYYEDGNTLVDFTCMKHDAAGTVFTINGLSVTVIIYHPIYVKEHWQERDIDRINEWVSTSDWMNKRGGYAPNASGYFPYQLYDNDTLVLRIPADDVPGAYIEVGDPGALARESGALNAVNGEINVSFRAHNTTNADINTTVTLKDSSGNIIRTMYVRVPKRTYELLDHADIEIADGGKYTVTKLTRQLDGTVMKTITEYRAYVLGVNSSALYHSADDSQPCNFYYTADYFADSNGNTYLSAYQRNVNGTNKWFVYNGSYEVEVTTAGIISPYDDSGYMTLTSYTDSYSNGTVIRTYRPYQKAVRTGITGYLTEDYWVDPTIPHGSPQYELTSKYNLDTGQWSNIKYYPAEVDHVVFDVVLALEPSRETVYRQTDSGWAEQSSNDITGGETKQLPSVRFSMKHQDVLDAYNKCPNHTGLDFTVMAYSALIEFDVSKKLTGGTIQADQFEFEVLQQEVVPVRAWNTGTAVNKSDYSTQIANGLKCKGAYRIFYSDGNIRWGSGIDSAAVLRELQADAALQYLNSADAVFEAANNDADPNQQAVLDILKKHLTVPDHTETDTQYRLNHDGFYLLAFESDAVQTVRNNADGIVTFNTLHFEQPGIYRYIIREKNGGAAGMIYDNTVIGLQIEVTDGGNNQLTANILSDITALEFTNHVTFRLPETGGTGILPYALGGFSLLGAAVLLRKRKEAG